MQNQTMITQNNYVSIVITSKSIIGIIFLNFSKTIYAQNFNQGHQVTF